MKAREVRQFRIRQGWLSILMVGKRMAKCKSAGKTALTFHPLTPERWDDFETLFGLRGACGGCWCMYWRRARPAFEKGKGAGNRRAMKALVESGTEPGILAYAGDPRWGGVRWRSRGVHSPRFVANPQAGG